MVGHPVQLVVKLFRVRKYVEQQTGKLLEILNERPPAGQIVHRTDKKISRIGEN